MYEIEIVEYKEKKEELINLFKMSFGHSISPEFWDWKHTQNPCASDNPEVIVATNNGEIVGARPLLFFGMWIKDKKVKAAQPCDTMVHPKHRRKGIFSRMNQFAIEYFKEDECAFFYNFPGTMSRPGYLKQGWKIVSIMEPLFRAINPQEVISYKLGHKVLGRGLGFLYATLLNARVKKYPLSNSFDVIISDQFIPELESLDGLRDRSAINIVRSKSYLKWRFDKHPKYNYKYIVAKRAKSLWGYAIVSVREQGNRLMYGMIMDYLVKNNNIDCLRVIMSKCIDELEKLECDLILTWSFPNSILRRELIHYFRFKSSVKFPYNKFLDKEYFVTRYINKQVMRKVDIYDKRNWNITYSYRDCT